MPLSGREFGDVEGLLLASAGAHAETPAELEEAFDDEFFWVGLSWLGVAKCLRVLVQRWLNDGWAVPARLWRELQQRAMIQHESGARCCETCGELTAVLLSGGVAAKLGCLCVALRRCW